MLVNISTQCKILVYYLHLPTKKYNMELVYQASPVSKVCRGSFSENEGGLNIWGTEKVLIIDLFLNAYRINLGYCVSSTDKSLRCCKVECKKKLTEEILILWGNSSSHTSQIA